MAGEDQTVLEIDLAEGTQIWVPGTGQDTARYLVNPGFFYHQRPSLVAGNFAFTWPVGVEGFRLSGSAQLGIYRYLGDDEVDLTVTHKNESRVELRGVFPGVTAPDYMVSLVKVIKDSDPAGKPGKILSLPGILPTVEFVEVENYDFGHDENDYTHSMTYSITFVRLGSGRKKVEEGTGAVPPEQGTGAGTDRGTSAHTFKVRDGYRTFRAISKRVYGDAGKWRRLIDKNRNLIKGMPAHKIPYHRWPIGTPVKY